MQDGIYIFGGPGAGTTALAAALSKEMGYFHLDAEEFIQEHGLTYGDEAVVDEIKTAVGRRKWILSGDIRTWGDSLLSRIDAIVFLVVPLEQRLERLRKKAVACGMKAAEEERLLAQGKAYDDGMGGRCSYERDCQWLREAGKPILRLFGEESVSEWVEYVMRG